MATYFFSPSPAGVSLAAVEVPALAAAVAAGSAALVLGSLDVEPPQAAKLKSTAPPIAVAATFPEFLIHISHPFL